MDITERVHIPDRPRGYKITMQREAGTKVWVTGWDLPEGVVTLARDGIYRFDRHGLHRIGEWTSPNRINRQMIG